MELKISATNAQRAYNNAGPETRALLTDLLGADTFKRTGTDWIKTFEDVCEAAGVDPADYEVACSEPILVKVAAQWKRLLLIAQVFNDGWKPNLADTSQYKYYPWFKINPINGASGFGLSFDDYVYDFTYARLGVRPYFKDSKTAEHVGKLFLKEYESLAYFENQLQ